MRAQRHDPPIARPEGRWLRSEYRAKPKEGAQSRPSPAAEFEPSCDRITYELVGCGDDGLMTPQPVLESLYPVPLYIQYQ